MTTWDLVVGIGSPYGDDAAGLLVVRRLAAAGVPVRTVELSDVTCLLDLWRPDERVAVVDAVRSGAPPGTVHVLDMTEHPLPAETVVVGPRAKASTHGVGLPVLVELARALGRLPRQLVLYGIEGVRHDLGQLPSAEVLAAVRAVAIGLAGPAGPAGPATCPSDLPVRTARW